MDPSAIPFQIHPSSGVPIYRQLMDQVAALAASGRLRPGDLLPSVRQLAEALEVNMMTVSKAYTQLERDGLVERDRGIGMRVKARVAVGSVRDRQQDLRPFAEQLVTRGRQLGLTDEQLLAVVDALLKERPV